MMKKRNACPLCGAPLEVVADGLMGRKWFTSYRVEVRLEARPVVACSGCEFCATEDDLMAVLGDMEV